MTTMSRLSRPDEDISQRRRRGRTGIDFRLIYAVCFSVFLMAALVTRLMSLIRFAPGSSRSVVEEARSGADTATSYAFMG